MLASELAMAAPAGIDLHSAPHAEVDVTDAAAVAALLDAVLPELVINATGYTAVDRAETERDLAFAVNGTAVDCLGRQCAKRGISVVHFSTDYVFDGTSSRPYLESDPAAPVNCYGASKLAGERGLLASGASALVIRAQWLFGRGSSFPVKMWERATRREPTRVVDDQHGRPTSAADLSRATWQLIARQSRGIFHVANAGVATWYDVAERVFARAGTLELLSRCRTADFPQKARRPLYTVLDTTRMERELGASLPLWESSLERFFTGVDDRKGQRGRPSPKR